MNGEIVLRPRLARVPDARRGTAPLLDPFLLPYLAVMLGSFVAALAGVYNAVALRRLGLALQSLALGVVGVIGFAAAVRGMQLAGVDNPSLLLTGGRVVHFIAGGVLTFLHQRHVRGHSFLGGHMVDVVRSYAVSMLLYFVLPWPAILLLLGGSLVR